ncbi:permease-like cell division protein FtsX [Rapidithrix thailandica]|uniref:Cell division protein FtsX n=1 Tax=Rapidithrix thailandica TaxID=413964 RepID=A0AAW9SGG7_9BACT
MQTQKKHKRKKKRLGSYPYSNVLFSITAALFMIGMFSLLSFYAKELSEKMRNNIEIRVFLNKDLSSTEVADLQQQLEEKEYIDQKNGVPRVHFLSKDEAAREMIRDSGEDFISFLGDNPLRDAYIVYLEEQYFETDQMQSVVVNLEQLPGVFEVVYTKSLVEEINNNIRNIGTVIGVFVCILLLTVFILIDNAIKLALFSQRFLIRSMQLVGATSIFIKMPFLKRAAFQGALSGFLASCLLGSMLWLAFERIPELQELTNLTIIGAIFTALILLGALIGFSSAFRAVSRYLTMKLDDLY